MSPNPELVIREFSFSTTDGSATVMMTFGAICACFGLEDGRPSISTTVLGMNLRCAENDNVCLKTVAEPSVVENENSLILHNNRAFVAVLQYSTGQDPSQRQYWIVDTVKYLNFTHPKNITPGMKTKHRPDTLNIKRSKSWDIVEAVWSY